MLTAAMKSGHGTCLPPRWVHGTCICLIAGCSGTQNDAVSTAADDCRLMVSHTSLEAVEVVAGSERFWLELDAVPAHVQLLDGEPEARIEVLSPLRFSATIATQRLPLRVALATDLFGGRIHLGEGAAPVWTGTRGDLISFSLARPLGLTVNPPLAIPCRRLGLGDWRRPPRTPEATSASGERVALGCSMFPLYSGPEGSDAISVQYGQLLDVFERRPGWTRIGVTWSDGSALAGWIREPASDSFESCDDVIEGDGVTDFPGRISNQLPLIPAALRAGADVAASAGGSIWARVTSGVEVALVVPDAPSDWIRVAALPGLLVPSSTAHEHIWVRANDVTFIR